MDGDVHGLLRNAKEYLLYTHTHTHVFFFKILINLVAAGKSGLQITIMLKLTLQIKPGKTSKRDFQMAAHLKKKKPFTQ